MLSSDSSYSSSNCSSDPHLPYHHQQTLSTLSLGSQHPRKSPMPPKYPRFYASPMDDSSENPVQAYGLEQREPSIHEKPKLLRRVSHALDDIKEDVAFQLDTSEAANKIKRRSASLLDPNFSTATRPPTSAERPRSRPMSIMSVEAWTAPQRRLTRRLSRRLSVFSSGRKTSDGPQMASISSPNLIGSSSLYAGEQRQNFI